MFILLCNWSQNISLCLRKSSTSSASIKTCMCIGSSGISVLFDRFLCREFKYILSFFSLSILTFVFQGNLLRGTDNCLGEAQSVVQYYLVLYMSSIFTQNDNLGPFWVKIVVILWICLALQTFLFFSQHGKNHVTQLQWNHK